MQKSVQGETGSPPKGDHRIPVSCRHSHKKRLHHKEQVCCVGRPSEPVKHSTFSIYFFYFVIIFFTHLTFQNSVKQSVSRSAQSPFVEDQAARSCAVESSLVSSSHWVFCSLSPLLLPMSHEQRRTSANKG